MKNLSLISVLVMIFGVVKFSHAQTTELLPISEVNRRISAQIQAIQDSMTGHENIEVSSQLLASEYQLQALAQKSDSLIHSRIQGQKFQQIRQCLNQLQRCSLFYVQVTSENLGGFGIDGYFMMINRITGQLSSIKILVYQE